MFPIKSTLKLPQLNILATEWVWWEKSVLDSAQPCSLEEKRKGGIHEAPDTIFLKCDFGVLK